MWSVSVWLFSLVLCWGSSLPQTSAAVYYVTPHSSDPNCPSGEPCFTLNEYAQEDHFTGDDNVTLLFLNGEHNLSAQNFVISHKKWLEITSSNPQPQVVIRLMNGYSIMIEDGSEVKLSALNLISKRNVQIPSDRLSISGTGTLSIANLSIDQCLLSLERTMNVTIFELSTNNSKLSLSDLKTLILESSTILYSVVNITSNVEDHVLFDDGETNDMSIESSWLDNSLVTSSLSTQVRFRLSVLNTAITSNVHSLSDTGIRVEAFGASSLDTLIKDSHIVGNTRAISIKTDGNTSVGLTVDQCYLADNGRFNESSISVHQSNRGDAETSVSITSTELLHRMETYNIEVKKYAGNLIMNIFNCTIRRDLADYTPKGIMVKRFKPKTGCYSLFVNITQTFIQGNALTIMDSSCVYSVFLFNNTIVDSYYGLYLGDSDVDESPVYATGNEATTASDSAMVKVENCLFSKRNLAAINIRKQVTKFVVLITGTVIEESQNGVVMVHHYADYNLRMIIKDSVFQRNFGYSLLTWVNNCIGKVCHNLIDISLQNVTFFNNTNTQYAVPIPGVVRIKTGVTLSIEDSCVFRANKVTAIQSFGGQLNLSGSVTFEDNVALQGGAIYLSFSKLVFVTKNNKNTNILFLNNTATDVGGAIYVEQSLNVNYAYYGSVCFYDMLGVNYHDFTKFIINVTMTFNNNTARKGGADLYGATPNSNCQATFSSGYTQSYLIKNLIFHTSSDSLDISSVPKRVCLCDSSSQPQCANISYIFYETERYPGEVFTLSLVDVGFDFDSVTGAVYANLLSQGSDSMASLGSGQHVRQVNYNRCTSLEFTVNTLNPTHETIVLTTKDVSYTKEINRYFVRQSISFYEDGHSIVVPVLLLTLPVYINVTLLDCPPGFRLDRIGRCVCDESLERIGLNNCTIYDNSVLITRSGNIWLQRYNKSLILYSKYCPFNYCKQEMISLNVDLPEEQCALSHTGILCGGCPSNLSLAIGSSACLDCQDNVHLLLLVVFAVAGILLVLFIKILNMTVTMGTINGLILYVNIIWVNKSVLFPPQTKTSVFLLILKTFIAWLNLDFGIQTCFIQHLDGYWKTWLQFAFPAYIWLIAGVIILISHYSIRATRMLGNNSVSVLATLLLLSYAKLLRTILVILQLTVIESQEGQQVVWSFDGNVPYFDLRHSILFVVGLTVLLVLWLPYTTSLLFIQWLRRYSDYRLLRWVHKLGPLFDSYLGPLKDKHHYWIGLGLLVRLILLLVSTITLSTVPFVAALLTTFAGLLLSLLVLNVYKQWQLGLLEGGYLVNMAMFSSGALYVDAQGGNKDILACVSLSTAFILFLAIIGYHVWKRVLNGRKGYEPINGSVQTQTSHIPPPLLFDELREPIL